MLDLPYLQSPPKLNGLLRFSPEDFRVDEVLGFEPCGDGEHVFVNVEKTGCNTQFVANQLAKFAGVSSRQVSYSGMKDKQAVTTQWFSVHLPGKASLEWPELNNDAYRVLEVARHNKKLRRGVHRGNRFAITCRQLQGDREDFLHRAELVRAQGVPNYFGEQRFGFQGGNIEKAKQWFAGELKPARHLRGIYLSAARSHLFNEVLAKRLREGSWCRVLEGEVLMLAGTQSTFDSEGEDFKLLQQRVEEGDLHTTGPLYASEALGLSPASEREQLEQQVFEQNQPLIEGLKRERLKAQRRALRVIPSELKVEISDDCAVMTFSLPSGCFATSVVRELLNYQIPPPVEGQTQ